MTAIVKMLVEESTVEKWKETWYAVGETKHEHTSEFEEEKCKHNDCYWRKCKRKVNVSRGLMDGGRGRSANMCSYYEPGIGLTHSKCAQTRLKNMTVIVKMLEEESTLECKICNI